jgi:hypothetical protein
MDSLAIGELVKVATTGPEIDGIVFDTPSRTKAVVAVMDSGRGPVFRTVHPDALSPRSEAGADDRALQLLIRRTPPSLRAAPRGGSPAGHGSPGHARGTMHRTTGK